MDTEPEVKAGENNTCYRCGGAPSAEPHECPFASEIHGNCELCNCCDGCQHECAMDI